jgi:putative endonuclease
MTNQIFWVYILHCENNAYYTGYTNDLAKRFLAHVNGTGSKYTRSFKPLNIVFSIALHTKSSAMKLEKYIKRLSRAQKEKLIANPSLLNITNN